MLAANSKLYTESICIGADGFCFTRPDGSRTIAVRSPYTAVPCVSDSVTDRETAESIFRGIFPSVEELDVKIDHVGLLRTDIIFGISRELADTLRVNYPDAEVHSHICSFLTEQFDKGTVVAVWQGEEYGFDIFAVRDGRLQLLNVIRMNEPYQISYYILKVWKEVGFKAGENEIRLYGFSEGPVSAVIRNLKLMTGDSSVCVL